MAGYPPSPARAGEGNLAKPLSGFHGLQAALAGNAPRQLGRFRSSNSVARSSNFFAARSIGSARLGLVRLSARTRHAPARARSGATDFKGLERIMGLGPPARG